MVSGSVTRCRPSSTRGPAPEPAAAAGRSRSPGRSSSSSPSPEAPAEPCGTETGGGRRGVRRVRRCGGRRQETTEEEKLLRVHFPPRSRSYRAFIWCSVRILHHEPASSSSSSCGGGRAAGQAGVMMPLVVFTVQRGAAGPIPAFNQRPAGPSSLFTWCLIVNYSGWEDTGGGRPSARQHSEAPGATLAIWDSGFQQQENTRSFMHVCMLITHKAKIRLNKMKTNQ